MRIKYYLLLILSLFLLSACSKEEVIQQEQVTIYLQTNYNFGENRDEFIKEYNIDMFEAEHPNIRVEPLWSQYQGERKPDILIMESLMEYEKMVGEGKLLALDPFIQQTAYDPLDAPRALQLAIQILRDHSEDHSLFGFPQFLLAPALYYRVDVFDHFGIPHPTNQMTWKEVIELAQRFPTVDDQGEPFYGLVTNYYRNVPFLLTQEIAWTEGFPSIDPVTLKVNVDTPEWLEIWEYTLPAFREQAIRITPNEEGGFVHGAIFMGTSLSAYIISRNKVHGVKSETLEINWNVVNYPINPNHPNVTSGYSVSAIYGIAADSQHPEAAWTFLTFLNDKTRKAELSEVADVLDDRNMEHIYMRDYERRDSLYETVPLEILRAFEEVGNREAMAVIEGRKSAKEALETLQAEGQQVVDAVRMELEVKAAQQGEVQKQ